MNFHQESIIFHSHSNNMLVFENPCKVNNNDLIKYQLEITDLNTNDLLKSAYKVSDLRLFFFFWTALYVIPEVREVHSRCDDTVCKQKFSFVNCRKNNICSILRAEHLQHQLRTAIGVKSSTDKLP